jgi:hypothetical protein
LGKIHFKAFNTHVAKTESSNSVYTLSGGFCASDCAYVFLGGKQPSINKNSKYGVHQVFIKFDKSVELNKAVRSTQNIISIISKYVEEIKLAGGSLR